MMMGSGMPMTRVVPRKRKLGRFTPMANPPLTRNTTPERMVIMDSVVMSALIFSFVMNSPLSRPMAVPAASPRKNHAQ